MTNFDLNMIYRFDKTFRSLYDTHFSKAVEKCEISRQEADILVFLANNPDFDTATDISLYRGISKAYVSKALDSLAQKGYVSFATDQNDRRCQHIYLSHHADEAIEILLQAQDDVKKCILTGISEADAQLFLHIMQQIIEHNQG